MRAWPLLLLLASSTAIAQPKKPTTFAKATTYSSCTTSTMFACGMRDASGHTYGTAKEMKMCTRFAFLPDGTYTSSGDMLGETHGHYRLQDKTVTLTEDRVDPADPDPTPYDLQLGKLTLVTR